MRLSLLAFVLFFGSPSFSQGVNNLPANSMKTIFLNFHLKEVSTGKNEVELKDFEVVSYHTKEFASMKESVSNAILVLLKNADGEIIAQQTVTSPINENLEVPSQDGNIQSVTIAKPEANFSVRLPYNNTARKVEVYQLSNKKLIQLASFNLK